MSDRPPPARKSAVRRLAPLLVLVAGIAAFFAFDLGRFVSFEALQQNSAALTAFVEAHAVLAVLAYVAGYALIVALSLPVGTFTSMLGGFLFGALWGTVWVVLGATAGAVVLFLLARSTLGAVFRDRAGGVVKRLQAGFRANEISYLLLLRLVPVFPFFVVNIGAALMGVRLKTYVATTMIGIVPGAFVYASVGSGTASVLDDGMAPGLDLFLRTEILLPIAGLCALALLPVLYRSVAGMRRSGRAT